MKIFEVLNSKQEILGAKFIQASAGCGKTFTIEHIVIRLLLENKTINIENILVVTFTKKATAELKFRIKNKIDEIIKILTYSKEHDIIYDYLHPFLKGDKKQGAISKLKDALLYFDQAPIFTIHGFCFRSLKDFSLFARVNIDIEEKQDIE
nr:RecBCD enzyme subunit RecB [Candidatus Anoxychlamydiales bacterium]